MIMTRFLLSTRRLAMVAIALLPLIPGAGEFAVGEREARSAGPRGVRPDLATDR